MAAPHDAPSAGDLVAAVREFLQADVLPGASGRLKFHTLVAVSVLGMVERELELGPGQAAEHTARLAALGFADDAALAAAIRSGALDEAHPEVRVALLAAAAAKLAVADPGYPD